MTTYDFDCGCKLPVLDETVKSDGFPSIEIDYYNLNHRCNRAWQLFCDGKTKGVFQLEKNLGVKWSKLIQPVCIEEVSALVSLIRPGCLRAMLEGKSMTTHFADRKSGEESYENFHPQADAILDSTYGVVTYQEQTLALARLFAGFDLVQADMLRRAIGKKKADVMAECRGIFIEGCQKTNIINQEEAKTLFDIIEKSNRYSFNKAHGVEYAETAYWCAYAKAHFPVQFFCSWLSLAGDKQKPREEVRELIQDSKAYGIEILPPSIFIGNDNFIIEGKNSIRFGAGNVKSVGYSKVAETFSRISVIEQEVGKSLTNMNWYEVLIFVLPKLHSAVVNNLISCGAFSKFGMMRQEMLFDYHKTSTLTEREIAWIKTRGFTNIIEAVEGLMSSGIPNKRRVETIRSMYLLLQKPPEKLEDSVAWVSGIETDLLGVSISCSKLDACDTSAVNCTCADFPTTELKSIVMALQIDRVSEWKAKVPDAKPMGFISAHDNTGSIEVSISSNEYADNNFLLFVGNTVIFAGHKSKKGSLSVKKVIQI
jgi:DNA polymerase III alpha subunit